MSDKDARSASLCLHSLDTNKFWFLPSITLDHCGKRRERGERRAHIDTEWLAGKTYRGHTRIDLTQEKKQMKYRVWLDARELCVPCGSLYLLLLIWLVMVCRVWGNTKTLRILQHKVSQMPKPHSRPVSVTLMQTLFSFPLLRSLSSYGCQETGKETKREGKTERCFAFFKTEVLLELDGWLAILGLYISIWDTGSKTCHFQHSLLWWEVKAYFACRVNRNCTAACHIFAFFLDQGFASAGEWTLFWSAALLQTCHWESAYAGM